MNAGCSHIAPASKSSSGYVITATTTTQQPQSALTKHYVPAPQALKSSCFLQLFGAFTFVAHSRGGVLVRLTISSFVRSQKPLLPDAENQCCIFLASILPLRPPLVND